jgi:hypothetical protein
LNAVNNPKGRKYGPSISTGKRKETCISFRLRAAGNDAGSGKHKRAGGEIATSPICETGII